MSGFEHYDRELTDLDSEIHRYAAVCGVNLANRHEVEACLRQHRDGWAADKARESLEGLLILRIKLETEMIGIGLQPPPLVRSSPDNAAENS
jgi:hypothetical protein